MSLATKVMISIGGVLLVLTLVGALGRSPLLLVLGLAALLGGITFHGSNQSTLDQIRAAIRERETRRAALIDAIALRRVPT